MKDLFSWNLGVVLFGVTFFISGCSDKLTIIVSDPQVFTRERLVQERYDEHQWLKERLRADTPKESTVQGLVDFREFLGFHNQTKVEFDPLQGGLDTLDGKISKAEKGKELAEAKSDLEGVKLDSQIAKTQKRKELIEAELELAQARKNLKAFNQGEVGEQTENSNSNVTNGSPSVSQSNQSEPTSDKKQDITVLNPSVLESSQKFALPDPSNAKTANKVKGGILDLFHDQMSFRNAVRAAMREKQLDDRHDLFGSTLYDLQFDITLIPENSNVDKFGRVTVKLQKDYVGVLKERHWKQYQKWVPRIRTHFNQKRGELIQAFRAKTLSHQALNLLVQVIQDELPGLKESMSADHKIISQQVKKALKGFTPIANEKGERVISTNAENILKGLGVDPSSEWKAAIGTTSNQYILGVFAEYQEVFPQPNGDETLLSESAIIIGELLDEIRNFDLRDALENGKHESIVEKAITTAVWFRANSLQEFLSIPIPSSKNNWDLLIGGSQRKEDKFRAFSRRLKKMEGKPLYASSIEPKEYAQNVSAVGAKETFLSLIASIQASIPQYGVTAENYSEYVRKTQQYVQSINRMPLAVGFVENNGKFGWLLGPKFQMRNPSPGFWRSLNPFSDTSLVEFSHVPVRHTFRASVTVPGWWDELTLCVNKELVSSPDFQGTENVTTGVSSTCQSKIDVNLPRESNWWEHLAHALIEQYTRAEPYIVYPNPKNDTHSLPVLREYEKDKPKTHIQSILIQGEELWRNPQVFVGGLQAKRVSILSNMEGISATFDLRPQDSETNEPKPTLFPQAGTDHLDLVVITSSGKGRVPKGVTWSPKTSSTKKPACNNPVVLLKAFYVKDGSKLKLKFNKAVFSQGIPALSKGVSGLNLFLKESGQKQAPIQVADTFTVDPADSSGMTLQIALTKKLNDRGVEEDLGLTKATKLELTLIPKPFSTPKISCDQFLINENKNLVYFTEKTQVKTQLVNASGIWTVTKQLDREGKSIYTVTPPNLKIEIPYITPSSKKLPDKNGEGHRLFYEAYPGFKEAGKLGNLKLIGNIKGKSIGPLNLKLSLVETSLPHYLLVDGEHLQEQMSKFDGSDTSEPFKDLMIQMGGNNRIPVKGNLTVNFP